MSILTHQEALAADGVLAGRIEGYEERPQQLAMAELVERAIDGREHAIVEAPTGVGKSFAYLVPAARHALRHGRKVVISTGTIALQEQLIEKDIPVIEGLFPGLHAVLVKGRQNYLSLRRLEYAMGGQQALFEDRDQIAELKRLAEWSGASEVGDLNDLGYDPDRHTWRQVRSDSNNCLGRRCPHYRDCFFYRARAELDDADILVVNHHLYFADLALRDDGAAILPAHDVVIFDEAHGLEDVATDHLGVSVTEAQLRFFCNELWDGRGKGVLAAPAFAGAREAVEAVRAGNQALWTDVALAAGDVAGDTIKLTGSGRFRNPVSPALDRLAEILDGLRSQADDDNAQMELRAQIDRAVGFAASLTQLIEQSLEHYVYYATVPRGRATPSLSAHPLSVADLLRERLWRPTASVILTSATLAADDSDRFLYLRRRIGLDDGLALRLDSPFDFSRQARLLINESGLDPNGERFERALAQWLGDFLDDAVGGTFILFTSYRQLDAVHALLAPRLERSKRFVMRQGGGIGRSQMLQLFKSTGDAVLFGTSSFWEGVDVRGDALGNVVIVKLPFEMPAHPLIEARHQAIKRRGGDPFMERSVPEAILRLKQGVGRLIRTAQDRGTIVICDHRVVTRRYGRWFLRALPDMPVQRFRLEDPM